MATNLDDPHCVFAYLKKFVSRYTLEVGESITGIPQAQIQEIAETMAKNRPGAILYALGMTQHTTGVQGIRGFTPFAIYRIVLGIAVLIFTWLICADQRTLRLTFASGFAKLHHPARPFGARSTVRSPPESAVCRASHCPAVRMRDQARSGAGYTKEASN